MTHTTNFNLSQWAKSDRIQMADSNADNQKIDAALADLTGRFYNNTYTGDGATTLTLTFPRKPVFVLIVSGRGMTVLIRGQSMGFTVDSTSHYGIGAGTWTDDSITVSAYSSSYISNVSGVVYALFAILDAD